MFKPGTIGSVAAELAACIGPELIQQTAIELR